MARPRRPLLLLCLLALALGVSACGKENDESIQGTGTPGEAFREGLAEEMNGLTYNVFITRQLNTRIPPDSAFYRGPDPGKGETLYGDVRAGLQRGEGSRPRRWPPRGSSSRTARTTSSGHMPLPDTNAFAYKAREVNPKECIPQAGSVAQQNSAAGALLVYKIPVEDLENRPLELEIEGGFDVRRNERGQAPLRAGLLARRLLQAGQQHLLGHRRCGLPARAGLDQQDAHRQPRPAGRGEGREPGVGVGRVAALAHWARACRPARRCRSCPPPAVPGMAAAVPVP